MDEADQAQALIELEAERVRRAAANAKPEAQAIGFCLSCDARLKPGLRWCDAACRQDHQRVLDAERRNGGGV